MFVDRERVLCVLLCQCVWTPVRLCFTMSAAVCQWVYEIEYMCVPVRGPGAGRALLRSRLPRRHWPRSPPPHTPILPFSGRQSSAGIGRGNCTESQSSPCHLAPGRCEVPARRAWARGPAGSQTDTSSPAAPLGAGPVAAPPLAGGPRVAAPSPRLHPPGAGPRGL